MTKNFNNKFKKENNSGKSEKTEFVEFPKSEIKFKEYAEQRGMTLAHIKQNYKCNGCGKEGHLMFECPRNNEYEKQKGNSNSKSSRPGDKKSQFKK